MSNNALNTIFREVGLVFRPLQHLDSPRQVTYLLNALGYRLPGEKLFSALPGIVPRIEELIQALIQLGEAEDDMGRLEAIAQLAEKIVNLMAEIHNLESVISNATSAVPNFVTNAPLDQLPVRLVDYLIFEYTAQYRPVLNAISYLVGIFELIELPEDPGTFQPATRLRKIQWESLPRYFTEPDVVFDEIYQWKSDFNSDKFLERLNNLLKAFMVPGGLYPQSPNIRSVLGNAAQDLQELRLPIFQNSTWPSTYSQFGISLTPAEARDGKKQGLGLFPYIMGAATFDFDLNETMEIVLEATATIDASMGIVIRHGADLEVLLNLDGSPADAGSFSASMQLRQKENTGEIIIVGSPGATRFAIEGPSTKIFITKSNNTDVGFEVSLEAIRLIISGGDGDGFISKILGDGGVNVEAGLTLGFSQASGFYISGSGGLEIRLPTHINIGPLAIQEAIIGLKFREGDFVLDAGTTLKLELGPFTAVVENIGLSSTLAFPNGGGNLGPANLDFAFKPPTGIGLSLDTPAVRGGGYLFFDPDNERYGGALELSISNMFTVSAVGLITTRLPDGSKGFSLLLIISVQFTPGIALGMGFFLSGLGGLIGIHRTISESPLREGVRNGSLDHILFPENIVANITRIITDIRLIFPPQRDQFMIGLMAKITWGVPALVSIEFGIIIEFTSPTRLAILGVLQVALPTEDEALVIIKVSFAGIINFNEQYLSFDASLFGSRILTFTLEGDMALRLNWGDEKAFLMSVGGFHPAFQPPARLNVGIMKRLTLNILSGNPRLTLTTYFALTSNTVQFGASIDFYFKVSKFKAVGYFGFDVLFQFSPFRFIAEIRAGIAIKIGSATLFSISLKFELAGPTPWSAKGTASFKILFFKVKVKFSKTWGERKDISLPTVPVLPELIQALEEDRNWTAQLPPRRFLLVSLRELESEVQGIVLQSFGSLVISQTILPLDMDISMFGNNIPSDILRARVNRLRIQGEEVGIDDVRDSFAPSGFTEMTDQDKLKSPSYVKERSGVRVLETDEIDVNYAIPRKVVYEVRASDFDRHGETPYELFEPLQLQTMVDLEDRFRLASKGGAVGRSSLSHELRTKTGPRKVQLGTDQFTIAGIDNMSRFTTDTFNAGTKAEANDQLRRIIAEEPELKGKLQVVADYQLAS